MDELLALLPQDRLAVVGAHAAALGVVLRGVVGWAKSGPLWRRIPAQARAPLMLALGLALGGLDHLASGLPVRDALFAGLGAWMGSTSTYEATKRMRVSR